MRQMYDSTTASDIPTSAAIVAGYCDGIYRWSDADWARFPNAKKVRIAISASTHDGHVLDIETGDATPAQAPQWAAKRRQMGIDPSVYVNFSNWAATRNAFISQGVPQPHYWVATDDGVPALLPGIYAKQYAFSEKTGHHYDLSVVADFWPTIDQSEEVMQFVITTAGKGLYITDGIRKRWLTGPGDTAPMKQGIPTLDPDHPITLSPGVFNAIPTVEGSPVEQ